MARCVARLWGVILFGVTLSSWAVPAPAADTRTTVLILSSEDSLLPSTRTLTDSIVAPFRAAFPTNLTIYTEFMDSSRGKADEFERESFRQMFAKYADRRIDLAFAI